VAELNVTVVIEAEFSMYQTSMRVFDPPDTAPLVAFVHVWLAESVTDVSAPVARPPERS
jgi:hypothetical protein